MAHSSSNSNYKVVPEATDALNKINGDISAKDAGRIGGNMVKKMIQQAESQMANK